jgi:hypothetical protein
MSGEFGCLFSFPPPLSLLFFPFLPLFSSSLSLSFILPLPFALDCPTPRWLLEVTASLTAQVGGGEGGEKGIFNNNHHMTLLLGEGGVEKVASLLAWSNLMAERTIAG